MTEPFAPQFISTLEANRTAKDELTEAASRQSSRRRISVTDLVNVRQAYFRRTRSDIEIPLERRQLMWAGTGFHQLFGAAVSSEEFLEQFLEMDGITGKVDIYEDVPVELKTTGSLPADPTFRPSYIDQLGMYCAMARRLEGQLLLYQRAASGRSPLLRAYRVMFADLDLIAAEMRRRRDLLAAALETSDPSALPRCEWNCDYSHTCGCRAARPGERVVPKSGFEIREVPGLAESLLAKLGGSEPARGFRLHDLVFPRRSLLERGAQEAENGAEDEAEPPLEAMERRGFQLALHDALRYGLPGAFKGVPVGLRSLRGVVRTFRGIPTLLRTSRFTEMVERHRLPYVQSHYFDRLAFDCALSGNDRGRLVVYYEAIPGDKFMVYDVAFRHLDAILEEADRRLGLLEGGGPPEALPPCPRWMSKFCAFAPGCGCGDE